MKFRLFPVEVVDKEARTDGWIFTDRCYYVTFRFKETGVVHERWVTLQEYHSFMVGKNYQVKMYHSERTGLYYFSPTEAEMAA